ncbi:MAG TPA: hypothetical protein PKY22_01335 [Accumulibacter sp.]|nr:hypothetical protein [Accumulibacter sp.]
MATQTFSIIQLGYAGAIAAMNAVPDPKHVWIDLPHRIVVLTGNDMPASTDPYGVTLNKLQLLQGALLAGGQPLWNDFLTYIQTTIPASGTPTQKNVWAYCNEFSRDMPFINQLRVAIQGAKTNAASIAEMHQVFILGSGYTP